MKQLTDKERVFRDEYLLEMNATKAALRAGYAKSTADKKASLWVGESRESCPEGKRHVWDAVKEALQVRSERTQVDADDVIRELARIGFSDIRKLFTPSGQLRSIHDLDDDTAAAIASVEVVTKHLPTPDGEEPEIEYVHKVKLVDKIKPLELIGKHMGKRLGQWAEKMEHTGKNGGPIETINGEMSPEEASKLYRDLVKS